MPSDEWLRADLRVRAGRGFVVGTARERVVITAGHCLRKFSPCLSISLTQERTYRALLGRIDAGQAISAECLFADPIADLAVLGSPDGQLFDKEAGAYDALVEAAIPLLIGSLPIKRSQTTLKLLARSGTSTEGPTILGPPNAESEAWLLSLDGRWFPCKVTTSGRGLSIENAAEPIRAGMSGSPIVALEGSAIGVVCVSSVTDRNRSGGPNAELWQHLPGWLLRSAQKNPESDPVTQLGAGVDDRQEQ